MSDIDGTFERECRASAVVERPDVPYAGCGVVGSLRGGSIVGGCGQTTWQRIGKRHVGCLSGPIVGNFDLEGNGVTFVGRCISTGERLDGDERCIIVDDDGFGEIVAHGIGVILVSQRCGGVVGDGVSTLTNIDRALKRERRAGPVVECPDGPYAS